MRDTEEIVALLTEIRDRLPEPPKADPEPAEITEEPPVGFRLADCHGTVWRRGERGWGIEGLIPGSNFDNPWSIVQQYAPLRPTTDDVPERPAGEHPDEALAQTIADAFYEGDSYDAARAAREHIEGEMHKCYAKEDATAHDRAEKAEADVERLTRERDEAREVAKSHIKDAGDWWQRYEALRKEGPPDDLGVEFWRYVAQQRFESLVEWKDRHTALRADVDGKHEDSRAVESDRCSYAAVVLRGILIRDDERGEQS